MVNFRNKLFGLFLKLLCCSCWSPVDLKAILLYLVRSKFLASLLKFYCIFCISQYFSKVYCSLWDLDVLIYERKLCHQYCYILQDQKPSWPKGDNHTGLSKRQHNTPHLPYTWVSLETSEIYENEVLDSMWSPAGL